MAEIGPGLSMPKDEDLLAALERAVDEVFSTMVCTFESAAVYRCELPKERVADNGLVELLIDGPAAVHIDREAVVEFRGKLDGRVVLRCSADGALDIARGLLMLESDSALAVEDVNDALKECANMVTGYLKTHVLDPLGDFTMSVPFIKDAHREAIGPSCGALVYRLKEGAISVEIWRRERPVGA